MAPKTAIKTHPAMLIPDDIETLQESILQIISMLRQEAPYYLMAAFGITKPQAEMLNLMLLANHEDIERERIQGEMSYTALEKNLSILRKEMRKHQIEITGRKSFTLTSEDASLIKNVLSAFYQTCREACGILGTKTLNTDIDYLSNDKVILQQQLVALLKLYRGAPEELPAVSERASGHSPEFSLSEKILLSVHFTALYQGQNWVPRHRLEAALYPPFVDTDTYTKRTIPVFMNHIYKKIGGVDAQSKQLLHIQIIDDPIRRLLGYPMASARFAECQPA